MAVKRWDGTQWVLQAGNASKITYQANTPSTPSAGDIWIESDVDVPSYDGTYQTGNRNFIINGNFEIWQRGTSFGSTGLYTADRWYTATGGSFGYAQSSTTPLSGSQYFMRLTSTSSPGALQQALETANVIKIAGQAVTLSYWIRSTTTTTPTTAITYSTSTDALASQTTAISVTTSPGTALIANTWTKQTVTFTVPSTALGLRISLAGATGSTVVDYSQVQLELGTSATPFEHRPYGIELALCQRYYYRATCTSSVDMFAFGAASSATSASFFLPLPVTLRVIPTGTITDFSTLTSQCNFGTGVAVSAITLNNSSTSGAHITVTTTGQTTNAFARLYGTSAGVSYLGICAEL